MKDYNSTSKLPKLSSDEIAPTTKDSQFSIELIRMLVTIAEIGIAFVPGLGVVEELAVSLTAGAVYQYLDSESDSTSLFNTALNFGLPVAGAGYRASFNLKSSARLLEQFPEGTFRTNKWKQFNYGAKHLEKQFPSIPKAVLEQAKKNLENLRILENLQNVGFSKEEIEEIKILIELSLGGQKDTTEVLKMLKNFFENPNLSKTSLKFRKAFLAGFEQISNLAEDVPIASIVYRVIKDTQKNLTAIEKQNMFKRFWNFIGSRKFYDTWVQRAQLIDPNDMGRAPIEALYQKIKEWFNKFLKRKTKVAGDTKRLEEELVSVGGIVLTSSWLLGYRVIDNASPKLLIMISFKPKPTYNKRPVLVWATLKQIEQLIESPGNTYQRFWAETKGGKTVGVTKLFGGIDFGGNKLIMHSVFNFIPYQQLRAILSIVSNYVENINDMVEGDYIKNWKQKFTKSFINTAISRSFRLGGNVVIGGFAKQYLGKTIGMHIGKELQRVGTNIFAPAIKHSMYDKKPGQDIWRHVPKAFQKGIATSVRGNSLRALRKHRPGRGVSNIISGRRKVSMGNRIPNALAPGRPYKGIKLNK